MIKNFALPTILCIQDIEHGAQSPDGSNSATAIPKKCEKAILARVWGSFDKKFVDSVHLLTLSIALTFTYHYNQIFALLFSSWFVFSFLFCYVRCK